MKNNKKRIALGILLGTIGIFGAGLYLRERDKVEAKAKKKKENKKEIKEEVIVREDTNTEDIHNVKKLCISILKRENPPMTPEDFLRELISLAMLGGDKLLRKMPRNILEMEDMLSDFKIYREYYRLCYSKLNKIEREKGGAIVVGKI